MVNEARRVALAAAAAMALGACGGGKSDSAVPARATAARVGPAGGTIQTVEGVTVTFPAGALAGEVEVRVNEPARREGEPRRIELEPRDTPMGAAATVSVKAEDGDARDERLVEIERRGELEIEHAIENEHEVEIEHAREAEIRHMGELEMREARACAPACDAGLECDDGACKPHGGGGEVLPARACVPACDAGLECDDGVCKPHGGQG